MTRLLLATCAALLVGPARAADPQPVWEIVPTADKLETRQVRWVGFSPDGKTLVAQVEFLEPAPANHLAIPSGSQKLLVWDIATRKEKFRRAGGLNSLSLGLHTNAITEAGTVLVPSHLWQEVRATDGKAVAFEFPRQKPALAVWANPKSRDSLWLSGDDDTVYYLTAAKLPPFDADPKRSVRDLNRKTTPLPPVALHDLQAIAASPDLSHLAVAGNNGSPPESTLTLYSIKTGDALTLTEIASVPGGHRGRINSVRFSPDGKTLATGSADSSIFLWDVSRAGKDWKPYATVPAGNFSVAALAFSPDGRTLAAGTLDQKARANLYTIEVRGGKLIAARRLEHAVTAVGYSPDGQTLITGHGGSGVIRAWAAAAIRGD